MLRVMLADLPALTADALAAIVDSDPALVRVPGPGADVAVIAAEADELPARAAPLLREGLVVLGIDPRGCAASVRVRRHGRPGAEGLRGLLRELAR